MGAQLSLLRKPSETGAIGRCMYCGILGAIGSACSVGEGHRHTLLTLDARLEEIAQASWSSGATITLTGVKGGVVVMVIRGGDVYVTPVPAHDPAVCTEADRLMASVGAELRGEK